MRPARLALRLELSLAISARELSSRHKQIILRVRLLQFLHYFLLLQSILPPQKTARLQLRALQTCAPRGLPCGLSLAGHGTDAGRQSTLTDDHGCRFIPLSALFPTPSSHLPAHKKHRGFKCRHYKHAPCDLALRLALSLECPTCGPSSRHERAIMRIILLHYLHYSMSHPSNTEKAPRHHALARGTLTRN